MKLKFKIVWKKVGQADHFDGGQLIHNFPGEWSGGMIAPLFEYSKE